MTQLQSRGTELIKALRNSRRRRRRMAPRRTARFAAEGLEVRVAPAVWTGLGADSLWSNPDNWEDGALPVAGDDLTFPAGAERPANNNNLGISDFNSITIGGSGYVLSGAQINLAEGITAEYSTGASSIGLALNLNDSATPVVVNGADSLLNLNGVVGGVGAGLSLSGGGTLAVYSVTTYDGLTTVSGDSSLVLFGAGSLAGPLQLDGGSLLGNGTAGGGIDSLGIDVVSPGAEGNSGILTSDGDVNFGEDTTFEVLVDGDVVGSEYSQLVASGSVSLGGASLTVNSDPDYSLPAGSVLTIIDNTGDDDIDGTFSGLDEGATLSTGSQTYRISYFGGDGNDVTLTALGQTTVIVSSSQNPSGVGEPVTFSANVSAIEPGVVTPTGEVALLIDGTVIDTVALDDEGFAEFAPIDDLAIGNYVVTVNYLGDDDFDISSGELEGGQTVGEFVATTTTVASSNNPSEYGQSVTFTATVTASDSESTPTGDAALYIDGELYGTVALDENGVATFDAISDLTVGVHTVSVSYLGNDEFEGSEDSLESGQKVVEASTTVTVTSSANPADFGDGIVFTATVAPNNPDLETPTGEVTLFIDGNEEQTLPVGDDGTVVFDAIDDLTVGSHNIVVSYSGDGNFDSSDNEESPLVQTVVIDTTTIVTASPTSSNVGEEVTFTATVNSGLLGSPPVTGSVLFLADGNPIEGGLVEVGDDGEAVFTTSALPVGSHEITAEYQGSDIYKASTGELETNPFVVSSSTSELQLVSNIPTSGYGQPVTFTANVITSGEGPLAAGIVTFINGETGEILGTEPVENGHAALTVSSLPVGLRWIAAGYSGDSNYIGSADGIVQETIPGLTSLELTTSDASESYGESVTFTATVSPLYTGAEAPSGTVTFINGETGEHLAVVEIVNGQATFSTSSLPVGLRWIAAGYSGDSNYSGSADGIVQETTQGSTTLALSSSSSSSEFGESVTFTATVTPGFAEGVDPTGTVTFINGETNEHLAVVEIVDGQATFTTSSLPAGLRWIAAGYSGDSNYIGSADGIVQETTPVSTTTTLASSANPAVFGQNVTYTANVSASNEGAGSPRGEVAYFDGNDLIGIAPVEDGQAAITLPATTVGRSHAITAQYIAESSWQNSTSSVLDQRVEAAQTETTLTATASSIGQRRAVILTARVAPVSPGDGAPTGRVSFVVNGLPFREAEVVNGTATIEVPFQQVARRGVAAVYEGSNDFQESRSPVLVIGGDVLQGSARPFSLV